MHFYLIISTGVWEAKDLQHYCDQFTFFWRYSGRENICINFPGKHANDLLANTLMTFW